MVVSGVPGSQRPLGASWFILYSKISGELLREPVNPMDFSLDLDDAIITRQRDCAGFFAVPVRRVI